MPRPRGVARAEGRAIADNVAITAGAGTTVAADEVADGTLGTVKVQFVKLMDGTLDGTAKAAVGANGLACDVKALPATPAGTNLIGKVSSGLDTSTINNGATALTPKFAAISASSSGNTTVVAAVTSKKIRVLSYRFQAAADVDVKFRDATAGVDLTGAMSSGAKGGGGGAAFSPVGHFETASGNALSINLSGAVQVSGHLTYIEV